MTQVRDATPADLEHIIRIAEDLHAENGMGTIHYPTAVQALVDAIEHRGGMIGLIGPVGDIQGIIFLRLAQFWYHGPGDAYLEELFIYVPPQYRVGTGNAKALVRFARSTAERLGVPLFIGVLSSERTTAKLKLYQRELGAPVGGWFFLEGVGRGRIGEAEAV